ncbi:MAG: TerD family protein [Nostoc sp. ChiQUE01a]|nr:TerD family protein [Nostoc sp. DcaGUA01]MDZ8235941.1 TerD family protein [Nostoc sp. ChiQUE01a]
MNKGGRKTGNRCDHSPAYKLFHQIPLYLERLPYLLMGDNLTGAGEGDDELIKVNLTKIPPEVQKIVVTLFLKRQL